MPEDSKSLWSILSLRLSPYFKNNSVTNKKTIAILGGFLIIIFYISLYMPPGNFPVGEIFSVSTGQSLETITNNLYEMEFIKSPFVFRTTVILLGGEKKVIAGEYLLDKKESSISLAYRLTKGKFHINIVKITIPEGWNIFEIAEYLSKNITTFDSQKFINLAKPKEGYLFPDTYFVSSAIKPEDLIEKMSKTFNEKVSNISGLSTTTYKMKDIIIMASILEREARQMESRRIIAGILWKRLSINMPLQVDSSFDYVNGKDTFELTLDDLKIDSPYNTYLYKGLPPGPIGNPGLDSIQAAINPIKTSYLYFLTSKDGTTMHYAKTFEEHKKNKQLYLK